MEGACLVVAAPELHRDPVGLVALVQAAKITTLHFVPPMLKVFIETDGVSQCTSIRQVICSGEALPASLVNEFGARLPADLHNLYGPTEAAVDVSFWACPSDGRVETVPIGRPVWNTQLYVLDRKMCPVPVGVGGELYLGGVQLARGYLNRADLTAEKFVPHPFSEDPGARLYKTGDLVKYLPDGNVEYLGRLDHQVKIRGFRIELGEIENALMQHPGVHEAVVLAREDNPGDKRLTAYVAVDRIALRDRAAVTDPLQHDRTAKSDAEPQQSTDWQAVLNVSYAESNPDDPLRDKLIATFVPQLRRFVEARLPDYMVPAAFVLLDALPLTPNGKVDRKALPAPDAARPVLQSAYEAPQTVAETTLASIWADVLKLERVGIHDNFFELGGDSILSIQIIARAAQAGLKFNPRQVFQHQTVAELARVAGTGLVIQAEQGELCGSVPLTPIQHWFFATNTHESHHFNQARLLTLQQPIQPEMIETVLKALITHHDALRLRFVLTDNSWQQSYGALEDLPVLQLIDVSSLPEESQGEAITRECSRLQSSLNLKEGPLMRAAYFNVGVNSPARLFIVVHHLAVDGVSWRILLGDLTAGLQQLLQGERLKLAPKTTSLQYWATRLKEYAESEPLRQQLEYWTSEERDLVHPLPMDYSRGANTRSSQKAVRQPE